MKREILFRGKRDDTGEWVDGMLAYFFDNPKNSMIMPSCYFGTRDFNGEDDNGNPIIEDETALGGFIPVQPESVGQFTGLLDKNGKNIFEGDILKSDLQEKGVFVVNFQCGSFCYYWEGDYGPATPMGWDFDEGFTEPSDYFNVHCQIIGNLQDNPELIGKEATNA